MFASLRDLVSLSENSINSYQFISFWRCFWRHWDCNPLISRFHPWSITFLRRFDGEKLMESSRKQTVMVFASANQFLSKDRIGEWSWIQGMSFAGATGVMNLATVTRLVESQRGSWLKFLWNDRKQPFHRFNTTYPGKKNHAFWSDKISWTGWNEGWFVDILSGSITGIGNWEYSHQLTKFGHLELSWIQGVISWDQDTFPGSREPDSQVDLTSGSVGTASCRWKC